MIRILSGFIILHNAISPQPLLDQSKPAVLTFRSARRDDITVIVQLLADDPLGGVRERLEEPLPASYFHAFAAIESDPNNTLLVAEQNDRVVGVLQLTFLPNMTYQGGWRAQIEGVRVAADARGQGVGRALIEHAVERAREADCHMIQLTTNKRRQEAVRFYEGIGFRATHEGMKLSIAGRRGTQTAVQNRRNSHRGTTR